MRLSLANLLVGQLDRYALRPMGGQRFLRYLNEIRDLGLSQLQEDQDAFLAAPVADVSAEIENTEPSPQAKE